MRDTKFPLYAARFRPRILQASKLLYGARCCSLLTPPRVHPFCHAYVVPLICGPVSPLLLKERKQVRKEGGASCGFDIYAVCGAMRYSASVISSAVHVWLCPRRPAGTLRAPAVLSLPWPCNGSTVTYVASCIMDDD